MCLKLAITTISFNASIYINKTFYACCSRFCASTKKLQFKIYRYNLSDKHNNAFLSSFLLKNSQLQNIIHNHFTNLLLTFMCFCACDFMVFCQVKMKNT